MNIEQQRAAFEAWYGIDYTTDVTLDPGEWSEGKQISWEAWQAALESPEVRGLRDVLERCRLALEPYDDVKPRDWKSDRENLRYAHQAVCAALAAMEKHDD